MYKPMEECSGGTPNILIFGLFLENESNLEVNNEQGIYSSYRSINSCIDQKKLSLFIFHHIYQNYLVAFKFELALIEEQFLSPCNIQLLHSSKDSISANLSFKTYSASQKKKTEP